MRANRLVSKESRILIFSKGDLPETAWMILVFSLVIVWIVILFVDFDERRYLTHHISEVKGKITSVSATYINFNEQDIFAIHYEYEIKGHLYKGKSHVANRPKAYYGQAVIIEYSLKKPSVSTIKDTNLSLLPDLIAFILLIPLIGFILLWFSIKQSFKLLYMLQYGKTAIARFQSKEETHYLGGDSETVYKIYFEFNDEKGQLYQTFVMSHEIEKFSNNSEKMILYKPENPEETLFIDKLPKYLRMDEKGNILVSDNQSNLTSIISPAICIIGYTLALFAFFIL